MHQLSELWMQTQTLLYDFTSTYNNNFHLFTVLLVNLTLYRVKNNMSKIQCSKMWWEFTKGNIWNQGLAGWKSTTKHGHFHKDNRACWRRETEWFTASLWAFPLPFGVMMVDVWQLWLARPIWFWLGRKYCSWQAKHWRKNEMPEVNWGPKVNWGHGIQPMSNSSCH